MPISKKAISVVIPTFGRQPDYLTQTIQSVISADGFPDYIDIAIVENGGPFETVTTVLKQFESHGIRRISHSKVLRVAPNWNRCLSAAEGRWIHLLHDDDYVRPDYYREAIGHHINDNEIPDILICSAEAVDSTNTEIGISYKLDQPSGTIQKDTLDSMCGESLIACAGVMITTEAYRKFGKFKNSLDYALDWECWGRISIRGKAKYSSDSRCYYRIHQQNTTSQSSHRLLYNEIQRVSNSLRNLFFKSYNAYPQAPLLRFALSHCTPQLVNAMQAGMWLRSLRIGFHIFRTFTFRSLPQFIKEKNWKKRN